MGKYQEIYHHPKSTVELSVGKYQNFPWLSTVATKHYGILLILISTYVTEINTMRWYVDW